MKTSMKIIETMINKEVAQQNNQSKFFARAIQSLEVAAKTKTYVGADVVLAKLQNRLAAAIVKRTQIATE